MVHGDDYISTGMPTDFEWMKRQLESKHAVKTQPLGPGGDGRRVIVYEADPRHAENLVGQLGLSDVKAVTALGTKEEGRTQEGMDKPLNHEDASRYGTLVARSPDRQDIVYSVKELARQLVAPTIGDWCRLRRLGRYLERRPRMQQVYEWQAAQSATRTYSDADWAGCKQTMKSTTGGCIMVGSHALKGRSKTQCLIALSSAEGELYAALKASVETLGVISMMSDMGANCKAKFGATRARPWASSTEAAYAEPGTLTPASRGCRKRQHHKCSGMKRYWDETTQLICTQNTWIQIPAITT